MIKLNDNIRMENFPVGSFQCNCSIIYSSLTLEAIIIDPGNDPQFIMDIVKKRKINVKILLHTHAHFDHIGGSRMLSETLGAKIFLHQQDHSLYLGLREQGLLFGEQLMEPGNIDHFIQDEEEILVHDPHLNKILQTIHTPGHTPGSCSFYSEKGIDAPILFSGDTLFNQSIGRTDLPGGDFDQILSSIKTRLLVLPKETTIIPGHGPNTSIEFEKLHNPFL